MNSTLEATKFCFLSTSSVYSSCDRSGPKNDRNDSIVRLNDWTRRNIACLTLAVNKFVRTGLGSGHGLGRVYVLYVTTRRKFFVVCKVLHARRTWKITLHENQVLNSCNSKRRGHRLTKTKETSPFTVVIILEKKTQI